MRSLKRPVASFSAPGVDYFSRRQGGGGENAEVVDDMSVEALEADAHKLFNAGYETKASSFLNFGQNRRSFAGAWKPVIDGKIQLPGESPGDEDEPARSNGGGASASKTHKPLQLPSVSNISGSSDLKKDDEGNDSDSEIRRVPELPEKTKGDSRPQKTGRKRGGGSSTDKEGKRLKRLLRNRVSAQQARERKKAYLIELERKAKELEVRNAELEEKNATLQRENYMLRQIVKNTTMRGGGGLASS